MDEPTVEARGGVDDADRLARARAGDRGAFAELAAENDGAVRGALHQILGRRPEVDDLVQETWEKALRALPGFRGDAAFGTWATRIAMNLAISELRRRRRADAAALPEVPGGSPPELHAERRELRERLAAAVDRLPPLLRQAFDLRYREDLDSTRAAERLGVPAATVRTRLFHARRRLREALDDLVSG